MATGGQKRTRSERVAALELPPGQWERAWIGLRRGDVLGRHRPGARGVGGPVRARSAAGTRRLPTGSAHVPMRDIVARAAFTQDDPAATRPPSSKARSAGPLHFRPGSEAAGAVAGVAAQHGGRVDGGADAGEGEQEVMAGVSAAAGPARPRRAVSPESSNFSRFGRRWPGQKNLARFDRLGRPPLPPSSNTACWT